MNIAQEMITSTEAISKFVTSLWSKSFCTQRNYGAVLRRLLDYLPDNVCDIRTEHYEKHLISLYRNHACRTVNLHIAVIRKFADWLETNYDVKNRAKSIKALRLLPPKKRIITEAEFHRLVDKNEGYIKDCLLLLAHLGLRAEEFVSLRKENFSADFVTVDGKGKKRRRVPLNSIVKEILTANPHLNFLKSDKTYWLWEICQKASKIAGIKAIYPHALRHYFATKLYHQGAKLKTISRLLGHSSVLTTELYLDLDDDDLLGSTECLV